jgi:hypothetical protein
MYFQLSQQFDYARYNKSCGDSSCHCMYIQIEIRSSFTSREMNAQSPLCSFDIFATNNVFMTVIVNVLLLYQKTLNYVDVRVMILAELIVVFIDKVLTIF